MKIGGAKGLRNITSRALESGRRFSAVGLFGSVPFYALLVAIAIFSIPYGAVGTSYKSLLVLVVSVIAGFRIIDGFASRSLRIAEPRLLAPLFGILGLAILQTVQWPGAASAISVDPYETKSFILIFAAVVVTAEVLFFYTTTAHRLKCLVVLVIAVGTGSAVFGLLREFYFDSQSAWLAGYLFPKQGFAQFINRNHFALLIEMAFGLLLGILLKGDFSEKFKFFGWVLAAVMGYSMIAANSRGGLVSMAALILFAVAVHMMTREATSRGIRKELQSKFLESMTYVRKIGAAAGILVTVAGLIVVVIAFVGGETTVTRFEKLKGEFETTNNAGVNRNLIWQATFEMFESNPIFGVGFGGYGTAIPKFEPSGGKYRLQQAHNDYLEILSNGGIVGFALFALFAGIVVRRASKNLTSGNRFRRTICFGSAIGIFGVLVHSLVDFGLHIPVNAFTFAVLIVIATVKVREATTERNEVLRAQAV
ncbi:MAG: O-antigen ligase family protein [Acidobacteria bacterium]|nr:O-antigen ligase family protein [Acidobacteriota bacterium]